MSNGQGGSAMGSDGQGRNPHNSGQETPNPYASGQGAPGPYTSGQDPIPYPPAQEPNPYAQAPGQPDPYARPQAAPHPHPQPQPHPQGAQPPFDPFAAARRPDVPSGGTPDWAALADASEERARKKRRLLIGGGIAATVVVASLVAGAIVLTGGDDDSSKNAKKPQNSQAPQGSPSESAGSKPGDGSSKAPSSSADPKDFISDEKTDTARLSTGTFFPGSAMATAGRSYAKGSTHDTKTCSSVTQGGLGTVLERNSCDQIFRATYTRDGIAVTVGVAVFGQESEALKAVRQTRGNVAPLTGKGVKKFCKDAPKCRYTANSYGRYAYFTATGYHAKKKAVSPGDVKAYQAGDDLAELTFRQIVRRGALQASAAAPAG